MLLNFKKSLLFIFQAAILISIITGCSNSTKEVQSSALTGEDLKYEILDDSVVNQDDLKTWINDNLNSSGVFSKSADESTYILISAGDNDVTPSSIGLMDVNTSTDPVEIKYEIIENPETTSLDNSNANDQSNDSVYESVNIDENNNVNIQEINDPNTIATLNSELTTNQLSDTYIPHMLLRINGIVDVKGIISEN